MSRCFPYPPPGYCRKGATYESLIESIKLQKETKKETNKTKAERKKEKRIKKEKKEKREKEKRNNEDEIKLQKNTNGDSQKLLQKDFDYTAPIIKTKTITELIEKSDLTEEYGQPISQHQPSYSSDSTQNSNKRKRDDSGLINDTSISHGNKSIKIRLLKKHKESDSSNICADSRLNSHPVKSTNPISRNNGGVQTKSNPVFEKITNSVKLFHQSGSKKSDVNILHPVRPLQQVLRFERHVLSSNCLEHEIPSSSVSRHVDQQNHQSCRQQQQLITNHNGLISNKKQKEDKQKVGPTRSEKKLLKKHSKYEKLVGASLFPPLFQIHLPDDDDWLSGSKTSNSRVCKSEVETCRQLVTHWQQPCARYLAEVDVHALPYTVPF